MNLAWEAKNLNEKILTNGVLILTYLKWWAISKSGIKIQSNDIWTHFWQKISKMDIVFGGPKKGVKCHSILILMPDMESAHHLRYFRTPFVIIFTFWFFGLQCWIQNLKCGNADPKHLGRVYTGNYIDWNDTKQHKMSQQSTERITISWFFIRISWLRSKTT